MSAQVAEVISKNVLKALENKEAELDEEIRQLEQADNDDLERLRERRLRELKREAVEREKWRDVGHGKYEDIDEKEFFNVAKQSPNMVRSETEQIVKGSQVMIA